jgi:hypothetical protein
MVSRESSNDDTFLISLTLLEDEFDLALGGPAGFHTAILRDGAHLQKCSARKIFIERVRVPSLPLKAARVSVISAARTSGSLARGVIFLHLEDNVTHVAIVKPHDDGPGMARLVR